MAVIGWHVDAHANSVSGDDEWAPQAERPIGTVSDGADVEPSLWLWPARLPGSEDGDLCMTLFAPLYPTMPFSSWAKEPTYNPQRDCCPADGGVMAWPTLHVNPTRMGRWGQGPEICSCADAPLLDQQGQSLWAHSCSSRSPGTMEPQPTLPTVSV